MMKKPLLVLMLCALLLSCKEKKQKDIDTMISSIKTRITEVNFKNNTTVDLMELRFLKCDTLTENDITLIKVKQYMALLKDANEQVDLHNSELELTLSRMNKYRKLGWSDMLSDELEMSKRKVVEGKSLTDSSNKYLKLVNDTRALVDKNKNPKDIYEMKMFIKATFKDKTESWNLLDTAYYHFNKDLALIN